MKINNFYNALSYKGLVTAPKPDNIRSIQYEYSKATVPFQGLKHNKADIITKNTNSASKSAEFFISKDLIRAVKYTDLKSIKIKVTKNNTLKIKKAPALEKSLNKLLKTFPDYIELFKFPDMDKDDIVTHSLETFKAVLNSVEYEKLDKREQNIIGLTALFHDLGKLDEEDYTHSKYSKIRIQKMMPSVNMKDDDKQLIIKLARHHYWSGMVKQSYKNIDRYAKIFKSEEFKLLKILTKADVKANLNKPAKLIEKISHENEFFFFIQEEAINDYKAKMSKLKVVV